MKIPSSALLALFSLLATGTVAVLQADEITLKDGRVIDGDVQSVPGEPLVEFKTRVGGMTAVLHFKASDIVTITYGKTLHQKKQEAFDAKRLALTASDGTADQWWALAEEAKALGESPAFRELAKAAIARDADFAPAHAALGEVKQDGKWMKPAAAAAARGEVFFRGKWVQAAEREGVLAEEARVTQEAETLATKERERRLAELEIAKKETELRTAQAAERRANDPAPAPQIVYSNFSTYTPYPTILRSPYGWGCSFHENHHEGPVVTPSCGASNGLSVQAAGQGNGFTWGVQLR